MINLYKLASLVLLAALWGCAGISSSGERPACRRPTALSTNDVQLSDKDLRDIKNNGNHKNDSQAIIDAALEKCQAANELWEKGDSDGALEALDNAYTMVLQVSRDADQSLLEQKEDLRVAIAKRIIKVYSSRFNAANGTKKAIPLVMNDYVRKAIESFQGPERNFFLDTYARSGQYRPMIVKILREEGLPEELSWLPFIESGFWVKAFSPARALGLWQFIASTGYKFGLERNNWVDERLDPQKSTKAAAAYLKELHDIFGDWSTSLAAYNCGEGTVLKVIRGQKVDYHDNFWDLYRRLPSETASFYPRFLAVLHITAHPQKYGFTLPPVDREVAVEEVAIDRQLHLDTIAATLGISGKQLKDLNPDLRKDITPPAPHVLKVPDGKAKQLIARLSDIPLWVQPVPGYAVHKIRKGDSLSKLAARYKTTEKAIVAMNKLKPNQPLVRGTRVKIPTGRSSASLELTKPIHSSVVQDNLIEYVVKEGDSIWAIAEKFRTSVKGIQSLNQLSTTDLTVGQVLVVTENSGLLKKLKTVPYKVRKGDSPYTIAKKHRMKVDEFLRLNRLDKNARIMPGDTLQVKAR